MSNTTRFKLQIENFVRFSLQKRVNSDEIIIDFAFVMLEGYKCSLYNIF